MRKNSLQLIPQHNRCFYHKIKNLGVGEIFLLQGHKQKNIIKALEAEKGEKMPLNSITSHSWYCKRQKMEFPFSLALSFHYPLWEMSAKIYGGGG